MKTALLLAFTMAFTSMYAENTRNSDHQKLFLHWLIQEKRIENLDGNIDHTSLQNTP